MKSSILFLFLFIHTAFLYGQPREPQYQLLGGETAIPFKLIDNRIFLKIAVNGEEGHFILDTGGIWGMDDDFARKLKLVPYSRFTIQGAGSERVEAWRTEVSQVALGNINASNISFLVVDLDPIVDFLHLPFADGVLGAELFRQYIVEINYSDRFVKFYEPETFQVEKGWEAIPFSFYRHLPMVRGSIQEHDGQFMIDTGDRSELTIFKRFAKNSGLRIEWELSDTVATGYGVGGPIYAQTTVGHNFIIGPIRSDSVNIRIPTLKSGAFATADIAGSIGGGFLKSHRIIFNYSKQELYVALPAD